MSPIPNSKPPVNLRNYARYSGLAVQFIVVLLLAVFGGKKLDSYTGMKFPLFTLLFSLAGLFAVLYLVIRGLTRK